MAKVITSILSQWCQKDEKNDLKLRLGGFFLPFFVRRSTVYIVCLLINQNLIYPSPKKKLSQVYRRVGSARKPKDKADVVFN